MSRPSCRAIVLRLGQHDLDFLVMRQIVQRGDDRPAVHLALVDLLGAVIEARRIAEADRVGGREQAERRVRLDHLVLVQQRQAAGNFQHALDHEHHVGTAGVIFVEHQRDVVLQRPRQDAVAEFGDLLAVPDDDRVLADQIDTADVAVEVDAHAGPIQPCRDLLDMGRFAGAVIAGDHDAAVMGEAGENRERGGAIEAVIRIDFRHMRVDFGIGRHFEIAVDTENLPDRHLHIGQTGGLRNFAHGGGRHQSSEVPGVPETRFVEWLRMGASANLAESNGPAEARGAIKVPLPYH